MMTDIAVMPGAWEVTDAGIVFLSSAGGAGQLQAVPPPNIVQVYDFAERMTRDLGQLAFPVGPYGTTRYLTVSRDGRWAIVFTEMEGCKETAFTSHVLDRVDLEHGEATRLSAAATHADVALGPDGSVYLDADGHVVRFAPGSTKPVADVLPGVRFALPDYDRDCSV